MECKLVKEATGRGDEPSDKLVQDFNISLHVRHLGRVRRLGDGEWECWRSFIEVTAAGLQKTADEDEFKEGLCIFGIFESGACLDEFVGDSVKIVFWDRFEMFRKLVAEYCTDLFSACVD